MADLKLQQNDDNKLDFLVSNNDFVGDSGLGTSIYLSLLKWRYDEDTTKNSWFADDVLSTDIMKGSRIYLMFSQNINENTQNLVNKYAQECIDWMLADNVASDIQIDSQRVGNNGFVLKVLVTKPSNKTEDFEYFLNWESQKLEIK